MEDEFTRRLDDRIMHLKNEAQVHLEVKSMVAYSWAKGEIKGIEYAKEIHIAMENLKSGQ